MDMNRALIVFDALSQETRLAAFRLLVKAGPEGLPAGALSEELAIPHNTMSFHLGHLANAGIVSSRKAGRSVIYAANFAVMHELIGYLVKDCCNGTFANIRKGKQSGSQIIELSACCAPAKVARKPHR